MQRKFKTSVKMLYVAVMGVGSDTGSGDRGVGRYLTYRKWGGILHTGSGSPQMSAFGGCRTRISSSSSLKLFPGRRISSASFSRKCPWSIASKTGDQSERIVLFACSCRPSTTKTMSANRHVSAKSISPPPFCSIALRRPSRNAWRNHATLAEIANQTQ